MRSMHLCVVQYCTNSHTPLPSSISVTRQVAFWLYVTFALFVLQTHCHIYDAKRGQTLRIKLAMLMILHLTNEPLTSYMNKGYHNSNSNCSCGGGGAKLAISGTTKCLRIGKNVLLKTVKLLLFLGILYHSTILWCIIRTNLTILITTCFSLSATVRYCTCIVRLAFTVK